MHLSYTPDVNIVFRQSDVEGLLLRWHSMNFSPERQHNSEPKAEDNYKR